MYKGKGYRKLGRTSSQRKALLRNQATDLIVNESIVTTEAKAKELRKIADKMVTLGKKGDLNSKRRAASYLMTETVKTEDGRRLERKNPVALNKLFDDLATRYESRNGGYTRITKLGTRRGDNSLLVKIELV